MRARGVAFRIFGVPMETWQTQMPRGMFLKSEGFASNLYDAGGAFPLARFCEERSLEYADVGVPVALGTFSEYGLAFAQRYVPDLDRRKVSRLEPHGAGFELRLEDGETFRAERVVVAVGISHFNWMPPALAQLDERYVTHTSAHHDLTKFRGRRVTVVGAGSSAVDTAALLHEAGADARLVARANAITFHDPPQLERSLWQRARYPRSGLGPNFKSLFYSEFPDAFSLLPPGVRIDVVRRAIGPAACWFTKPLVAGKVETRLGLALEAAGVREASVRLRVRDGAGKSLELEADHVIAGTGYRVDLARLTFISSMLREHIRLTGTAPALDRNFQCSVPGLYFVGVSAANTFGPLLRFAFGARFAARRLAPHIANILHA